MKREETEVIIKNSIGIILTNNFSKLFTIIFKPLKWFILTFLRPFWFSSSNCKKGVVAPYVYTTINMACFYIAIYVFLTLSWEAATIGIKNPQIVLPAIAGLIGSLIALNHSMITLYNNGKNVTTNTTSTTPPVVTTPPQDPSKIMGMMNK